MKVIMKKKRKERERVVELYLKEDDGGVTLWARNGKVDDIILEITEDGILRWNSIDKAIGLPLDKKGRVIDCKYKDSKGLTI